MNERPPHVQPVAPDACDSTGTGRATPGLDPVGELISHQILDVVDGHPPVPIDLWRVAAAEPAHAAPAGDPFVETTEGWRCTTRMAQLLIGMFAAPGTVVISVGFDPVLAGAAGAVGCPYQTVAQITDLASLGHLAGRVGLLLIPWPATGTDNDLPELGAPDEDDAGRVADWLGSCRTLMTQRGVTVVVLAPAPPTDAYVACARLLLPAARRAGLGWLQHIVAITTPVTSLAPNGAEIDAGPRPVAPRPAAPNPGSDSDTDRGDFRSVSVHADLLALVLREGRHG